MATGSGEPQGAVGAGRLPWAVVLAYGAPAAGYAYFLFFIQFYFLNFATDVLLASAVVMGALLSSGRLWDAVSDPLAGYWSDRTRSRFGRRRPWMLAAIPLMAGAFVLVWSPPAGAEGGWLVAWSAGTLLLFYTGYTVYTVPHQSLGAELSLDHHERSRVFGAQRMSFVLGILLAFGGIQVARTSEDPRSAALEVAIGSAAAVSLLLLWTPLAVSERSEHRGRGASSPYGALRDVLRNAHARVLLTAWFVEGIGGGVLGVLAPYITIYVLRRPELLATVPAFFVIAGVASIPLWVALSHRFGKKAVWRVALGGSALFFGSMFFVAPDQIGLLYVLLIGAGASNACGGAIGASMLADVIDHDEWRTGERKEGAYSAAWSFAIKLSVGVVVFLTGLALDLSGFQPNVEQAPAAEWTIRALFAVTPCAAALVAVFLLGRFRLDAAEHARIRGEIDERRRG